MKLPVFLLFCSILGNPASAADYILCRRDAEVRVTNIETPASGRKGCAATAKIQGISYKCAKSEEYADLMTEFLKNLKVNGKKKCEEFCKGRGKNCTGVFYPPEKCGFSVPKEQAIEAGKTAPCAPSCGGEAFVYCSIYHGSYLKIEDWMFKNKNVNCLCKAL